MSESSYHPSFLVKILEKSTGTSLLSVVLSDASFEIWICSWSGDDASSWGRGEGVPCTPVWASE